MDSSQGDVSRSQLIQVRDSVSPPSLLIDLKKSYPVNQINFHAANMAQSVPMDRFNCWAMSRHIRVTGANQPDQSDQALLFEYQQNSIYDFDPIIMQEFPEKRCRYIQIEIVAPRPIVSLQENQAHIAFSEIEVLSRGSNIAKGSTVSVDSGLVASGNVLV
jgi:hypothetical protein